MLATWGEQRTQRFKDTPTLKELGYNVVVDAPLLYLDGADYEKYVAAVYKKETALIERLKLRELMKG